MILDLFGDIDLLKPTFKCFVAEYAGFSKRDFQLENGGAITTLEITEDGTIRIVDMLGTSHMFDRRMFTGISSRPESAKDLMSRFIGSVAQYASHLHYTEIPWYNSIYEAFEANESLINNRKAGAPICVFPAIGGNTVFNKHSIMISDVYYTGTDKNEKMYILKPVSRLYEQWKHVLDDTGPCRWVISKYIKR